MAFAIEKEERFAAYNAQMCLVHSRRVREQLGDDFVSDSAAVHPVPATCVCAPRAQTGPRRRGGGAVCARATGSDGAVLPGAPLQEDAQLAREGRDREATAGLKSKPFPLLTCGLVAGIRHCHTPDATDHRYGWQRPCAGRLCAPGIDTQVHTRNHLSTAGGSCTFRTRARRLCA